MGFSAITIEGSDIASDLNWSLERAKSDDDKFKLLREECFHVNSEWNTPSYVNVALCLLDGHASCLLTKPIPQERLDLFKDVLVSLAECVNVLGKGDKHTQVIEKLHNRLSKKLEQTQERR